MKLFKLHFSLIFFIVFVSELHSQNAPITQSGVFLPSGPNASIPIKVLNFNSIGAISLTMEYDALIAQANTVTANPALAVGSFTYSILTPGSIVISWYSNTAVNLDDASDLFVISFSRVSVGTTSLVWFDDGTSCEYAKFDNGSYTVLNDSPSSTYYPSGQLTFQEDAPHTIVSDVIACANSIVHIPVTVSNFHDIGAISLTLDYNPSVLLFQGFTAESSLPSNFTVQSTIAGQVVASGYETSGGSGTSLADNTVLFTMDFM